MFANISEKRIANVFYQKDIGEVSKIDLVSRTNDKGEKYNMAFVHFDHLFQTSSGKKFREEVENPQVKAKLVYEDPWFWLVLPFEEKEKRVQRPHAQRPHVQQPPAQQQFYPEDQQDYFMGYGRLMMTAQGPMWYPMKTPTQAPMPSTIQSTMVPPHEAYRTYRKRPTRQRPNRQCHHQKKRINVPSKKEAEEDEKSTTSCKEGGEED
jgi:hypothetical protein